MNPSVSVPFRYGPFPGRLEVPPHLEDAVRLGSTFVDATVRQHEVQPDWCIGPGELSCPSLDAGHPGSDPVRALDARLAAFGCRRVVEAGGLVLHASAVALHRQARVFAARSGTGKSTTARRLCPPCTPLSDDQCILLPWRVLEPGRDCAGWACIDVRPGESLPVPLAAVHLLERGDRTEVAPLPRSEAFRRLLSHAVLIPAETETHAALLGAAGELLADVPVTIARVCLGDLSPATLGWPDSPAGPGQEAGIG